MKAHISAYLLFAMLVLAGYLISTHSWDSMVFVYIGEQRSPAAVRSLQDYVPVDRSAFAEPVHKQMFRDAKKIQEERYIGLSFGHPLLNDRGGEFACPVKGRPGMFDRVELTFLGSGISSSGQQPRMIVETPCQLGDTFGRLDTIWLPMQDIVRAPAKDQELQIYGERPVVIRLQQIPGEWPPTWVLWNVRFFNTEVSDRSLTVDLAKIREANGKIFAFDWQ